MKEVNPFFNKKLYKLTTPIFKTDCLEELVTMRLELNLEINNYTSRIIKVNPPNDNYDVYIAVDNEYPQEFDIVFVKQYDCSIDVTI